MRTAGEVNSSGVYKGMIKTEASSQRSWIRVKSFATLQQKLSCCLKTIVALAHRVIIAILLLNTLSQSFP